MSDSQTGIARRHFTLTDELNSKLNQLAAEHYNNNVSRLIRCAISDHERTLNGKDEFAVKSLESTVEDLVEEVAELRELAEDGQPIGGNHTRQVPTHGHENPGDGDQEDEVEVQRSVQSTLIENGHLSLEEIVGQVESNSLKIQEAIDSLLEKEYIKKETVGDQVQYTINQ